MTKAVNPFDTVIVGAGNVYQSLRGWLRQTQHPKRTGESVKFSVRETIWALSDQGIVSAGMFVLNVILARQLIPIDYGIFVLLFGGFLTLQLLNTTLLYYPLSVRFVVAEPYDQPRLLCTTLLLAIVLSLISGCFLAVVLVAVGKMHLVVPTLICLLAWQLQEGMRRGLLSSFRHKAAVLGDTVRNLGQAVVVTALAAGDSLTLASVLYTIAAASALAALIQAYQLRTKLRGTVHLRETIAEYWQIGGVWSLGNGLLAQVMIAGLPWVLAAGAGTAAVAGFQAACNIVALANPIIIGLSNIIPQVASQTSINGNRQAWRSTFSYAVLTLPVLLLWSILIMLMPEVALRILYGPHSEYVVLTVPLRLLIVGALASSGVEVIISYLHGVRAARLACYVNGLGALTTSIVAWPMIHQYGLTGACITVVLATAARLFAARAMLMRTLSELGTEVRVAAPAAAPRMPTR